MKRVKAVNGYTIYETTKRDVNDGYSVGEYFIYFSSDIREYGRELSEPDWECDSLEVAIEWAMGSNYARAKEIVEETTTAASFEEIALVEATLNAGMSEEEAAEVLEQEEAQTITSASTSINSAKAPAVYGMPAAVELMRGRSVIDVGGGRYDTGVEAAKAYGARVAVYDPYNRTPEHNARVLAGMYDVAIVSNVLNVINSPAARRDVLTLAAVHAGVVLVTVYEGDGSGVGRQTGADAWQENRKTADYVDEIRGALGPVWVVERHGKLIVCRYDSSREIMADIAAHCAKDDDDNPPFFPVEEPKKAPKKAKKGYNLEALVEALRESKKAVQEAERLGDMFELAHDPRPNGKLKSIYAWNILPVVTCGGHACPGCYAVKNALCHGYDLDTNGCLKAWAENTAILHECERLGSYAGFEAYMIEFLESYYGRYFRIHAAGDFFSVRYLAAWVELAEMFPEIRFLAYTKQFNVLRKFDETAARPAHNVKNLRVVLSMWPGQEVPEDLAERYPLAWLDVPEEDRIPEGAFLCPGDCGHCNHGRPECWYLADTGKDVKFKKH